MTMTWEDVKKIFRPGPVQFGKMKLDSKKCNHCGLCIDNCLFRTWEMDKNNFPQFRENWPCFSCLNCMVACPTDAISLVEPIHVDSGYFAIQSWPWKMPLEPRDAEGKLDEWNAVERLVLTRRSVRNFLDKPVPEPFITRVLEAGRFAPSAGNHQPWKFIVVTNKAMIKEMNEAVFGIWSWVYKTFIDDEAVKSLIPVYEASPVPGKWHPIVIEAIAKSILGEGLGRGGSPKPPNVVNFGAPVVILICCDTRAIAGPDMNIGICGQNMVLVGHSLGLKVTWNNFLGLALNFLPDWMERLGVKEPFSIVTALSVGYPKFKQEGVVPREFRPITWFREGAVGPEIQE